MDMRNESMHEHTVVGVFADEQTAQQVVGDLERNGIPRDLIRMHAERQSGGSASTSTTSEHEGGFFNWLFGSDTESYGDDRSGYETAMGRGHYIVSVNGPQPTLERAVDILNNYHPIDIDQDIQGSAKSRREAQPSVRTTDLKGKTTDKMTDKKIPVVEEELQVGKRAVRRGGVRVYSRVIEQPVSEDVHLREEHVRVERRPVDRPLQAAEAARLKDESIEVTETTEEPVVRKQARIKEEVTVSKDATERTETVRDTVRRTEVHVDKMGEGARAGQDDQDFRQHFQSNYAHSGATWETMDPAYRYGSQFADDPRYRGKSWSEVEPQFRTSYQQQYPNSAWDRVKDAVRYGWERATLRRRAA